MDTQREIKGLSNQADFNHLNQSSQSNDQKVDWMTN